MVRRYEKSEILDFLKTEHVMAIAAIGDRGPISSVLVYAMEDDFTMYFVTNENSYKAKALEANPAISISVWNIEKMLVQADGATRRVGASEVDPIMDKVAASMAEVEHFWPPIFRVGKKKGEYAVFEVKLKWVRALDLTSAALKEQELPLTEYTF